MRRITCAFALSFGLLGCSDDGPGSSASNGGSANAGGASAFVLEGRCEAETRLGGFELAMESDFSAISGSVYDRVARSAQFTEVGSDESCVLIERTNPYCDPPCSGGKVCVQSGSCEDPPTSLDLGVVVVQGLTTPVAMEPVQPGNRYFNSSLEHPAVEAGGAVRVLADGGELEAFELQAEGVSALETSEEPWLVERGKELQIAWTAAPDPGQGQVRVTLNIDQHGSSPVTLSCVAEDAGNLTISSQIIDQLLGFGVSGFATGNIYRETSDHIDAGAGCVDFALFAHQKRMLEVAGHQPCTKDADCGGGKTCDVPNNTCL